MEVANGTWEVGKPVLILHSIPTTGLVYLLGIAVAVLILAYMINTLIEHNRAKGQEKAP